MIDDAHNNAVNVTYTITYRNVNRSKAILRPTHQMACDWLREEKGILIEIEHRDYDSGIFRWTVYTKRNDFPKWVGVESDISNSYGEAIEAALKYSLENLV